MRSSNISAPRQQRRLRRAAKPGPRVTIRAAHVDEAQVLSQLAVEAKAKWGYAQQQLRAWKDALKVSPHSIQQFPTFIAELDGEIAGFYQLGTSVSPWELEHFWVKPSSMRQGVGRTMLSHAVALAAEAGLTELAIDADPNAEPFYVACGARRVGAVSAPTEGNPDRVRPQLRLASGKPVSACGVSRQAGAADGKA